MSCSDFERLIALYVEDDLLAAERARVKAHLLECSDCWDLAEDLKESQKVFKSIRQDVPDAGAVSVLHERVLSEVGGLETMTWFERFLFGGLRGRTAIAGIAVVLVGASALWLARSSGVTPVAPAAGVVNNVPQVVELPPVSEPQRVLAPSPPASKILPSAAEAAQKTKQVAIQFVTDDPNVIIYWLVDEKGD